MAQNYTLMARKNLLKPSETPEVLMQWRVAVVK